MEEHIGCDVKLTDFGLLCQKVWKAFHCRDQGFAEVSGMGTRGMDIDTRDGTRLRDKGWIGEDVGGSVSGVDAMSSPPTLASCA